MSREANVAKSRKCRVCGESVRNVTAKELLGHVRSCREAKNINDRLEAIGLSMPQMSLDAAELLGNLARNKKGPSATIKPSMGGAR